jgi:hypothetical protein
MSFLDRLVKHGLVHTISCSSNNGAFPVTEDDIAQYQKELAQQVGRGERRGRSLDQCSSSSSSCSLEDSILVHNRVTAVDGLQGDPIESTNHKIRTSSYDEIDMDNDSGYTFDMSLLPGQTSTQEGPDHGSENVIEVTLDENIMNPQGEDNVLLLRRTKKPLTVRGKAKQVILKPIRSGWCFVKEHVRSFRKWQLEQTTSWGRKQRRNLDNTASLDDEENELSEETMEFEQVVSPSVSGGELSFRSSNDNYDDVPSSTHSSR